MLPFVKLYTAEERRITQPRLHLRFFETSRIDSCIEFIQEWASQQPHEPQVRDAPTAYNIDRTKLTWLGSIID
jgi:hypothetical protein